LEEKKRKQGGAADRTSEPLLSQERKKILSVVKQHGLLEGSAIFAPMHEVRPPLPSTLLLERRVTNITLLFPCS